MVRKADEPYQKSESDSPYWIVPTPDGKFSVQAYLKPSRTVLDKLTQRQAERLQVYLTELMEDYNKLNICSVQNSNGELSKSVLPGPQNSNPPLIASLKYLGTAT